MEAAVDADATDGCVLQFHEQQIGLLGLDDMPPEFTAEPELDSHGVLTLTGRYDSSPSPVIFTHRYIDEGSDWRLVGIDVQIP